MTLFPEVSKTARLELRMPDPASAPAVNEAIRESFDTLSRWMDWADHIPSIEETHARLVRSRQRLMADEDYGLHVFSTDPPRYIGSAGLHPRSTDATRREIGYWIRDTDVAPQLSMTTRWEAVRLYGVFDVPGSLSELRGGAGNHRPELAGRQGGPR